MTRNAPPVLLPPAEDAERRDRGVELKRWLEAPATPATRAECEQGPRPCPHLRCIHHIGERGDGTFTCALDFAELPEAERTTERIADVLGTSRQNVEALLGHAVTNARRRAPHDVLIALGIRRRHA